MSLTIRQSSKGIVRHCNGELNKVAKDVLYIPYDVRPSSRTRPLALCPPACCATARLSTPRYCGVTLLELLLAVTLSALLVLLSLSLGVASYRGLLWLREDAALQASARQAALLLGRELRTAGHGPCWGVGAAQADIVDVVPARNWLFGNPGVEGYGAHTAPVAFAAARRSGSDSLVVRRGAVTGFSSLIAHDTGTITLSEPGVWRGGDVALLVDADCAQSTLLQVEQSQGEQLRYGTSGVAVPGNCSVAVGGGGRCRDGDSLASHHYTAGARLWPWYAAAWYIGNSSHGDDAPALYREQLVRGGSFSRAVEVVHGIEDMRLHYGLELMVGGDRRYATADEVTTLEAWPLVRSVRVALLLRSRRPVQATPISQGHFGGRQLPYDRYLRRRLELQVALRNVALR